MRILALVPLILAVACTGQETYLGVLENSTAGLVGPLTDESDERSPIVAWSEAGAGQLSGYMVTIEELDGHETRGSTTLWDNFLRFQFDAFTPRGWAMFSGHLFLDEPLAPGQTIAISADDVFGCTGPEEGDAGYWGGVPTLDGEILVQAGEAGSLVLVIASDFGAAGHMEATVEIEDLIGD